MNTELRQRILDEIARLTQANGAPPGRRLFERETAIRESDWLGVIWARWSDAIAEAGFQPNAKQGRADRDQLLEALVSVCNHFCSMPTVAEYELYRSRNQSLPAYKTLQSNFGKKDNIIWELRQWLLKSDPGSDLLDKLPCGAEKLVLQERVSNASDPKEGYVYLLKSGKHYKIGRSDELEKRIKQISVALPESVSLEHAIKTDDPPGIEAYWHRRFASSRANGEWFSLSPTEVRAFKKRRYQ